MMSKGLRKCLARAIIIDRAMPDCTSVIGRIARERTEENYRFASRFVAGKTVLDIGGGTGIGHDLIFASGAASLLSIDRHVASMDARARSVRGDFLNYPLPDESFDVIICLGTLFYIDDSDAAIVRIHRLLKPGGVLIINCINQRLIRRYFRMPLDQIDGKFSAAYDEAGLRALLTRHFHAEPEFHVQQPVPVSDTFSDVVAFWFTPLTWPFRRHPVIAAETGMEGMYVCANVRKNG